MHETGTPVGRRAFLGLVGVGVAGVVFGGKAQDWLSRASAPIVRNDPTGIVQEIAPIQKFRLYTVTNGFPRRATADYRLSISGLVDRPLTLTYDDILAMTPTGLTKDFQCVTGWRVLDVPWKGVKLRDLLERVGVQSQAKALRFTSFDGAYTESLTLDQAMRDDMLVAYEMQGKRVSSDHGGPVRLYAAPMYGYKSIKWLDGIEVVDKVIPGYWEVRGYDIDAWVGRSNGRDDDEPIA